MQRRAYLATIAGITVTAGCTTHEVGSSGTDAPTDVHDDGDTTATPDDSGFDGGDGGRSCPSFVRGTDRTVCYDGRGSANVYLKPAAEQFVEYGADDSVQTFRLTLHNGGKEAFNVDVNDWSMARRTESGWRAVASEDHADAHREVPPDGRYEWVLSTRPHASPVSENSQSIVVELDSGEMYAVSVHGTFGGTDGVRVECLAQFQYVLAVPE